jgi:hypothetical protein
MTGSARPARSEREAPHGAGLLEVLGLFLSSFLTSATRATVEKVDESLMFPFCKHERVVLVSYVTENAGACMGNSNA